MAILPSKFNIARMNTALRPKIMRIRPILDAKIHNIPNLVRSDPVYAPLNNLIGLRMDVPRHSMNDIFTHSLSAYNNAQLLAKGLPFTANTFTKKAYVDFFVKKMSQNSTLTYKDLVCSAALMHDIGMGMTMKDEQGEPMPVIRYDKKLGRMTAKGHEIVGAEKAYELSLALGLSEAEAKYVAFLVRNHMAFGGINSTEQDSMIYGFLNKVGFDLGACFVVLCDMLALDRIDNDAVEAVKKAIDYQFIFHLPLLDQSRLSIIEKIHAVPKRIKNILLILQRRQTLVELRGNIKEEHLRTLFDRMSSMGEALSELTIYDKDEKAALKDQIEKLKRYLLQLERTIYKFPDIERLTDKALRKVNIVQPEEIKDLSERIFMDPVERQKLSTTILF